MSAPRSFTVSPPGEPDRRAATRQQILAATRSLLAQDEVFARLSIQRIVAAAGVARATFYLHFRSKRELIAALAESETGAWVEVAGPFLQNPLASREQLELTVTQLLAQWREHQAVLAGIIELAAYDEETRQVWRDLIGGIAATIAEGIGLRRPDLPADVVRQLGQLIAWAGERYLHQEAGQPQSERDRLIVASLTELMWRLTDGGIPRAEC